MREAVTDGYRQNLNFRFAAIFTQVFNVGAGVTSTFIKSFSANPRITVWIMLVGNDFFESTKYVVGPKIISYH